MRGAITRKRMCYICPQCQSNALLSAFFPSSRAKRPSTCTKTNLQKRSFNTLNARWALLETSRSPVESFQDIPFGPSATGRSSPSSIKTSDYKSNSVIRNHLRAWSVENQKRKQQEAEIAQGDSFRLQRLAALPNSLFIEEASLTHDTAVDDEGAGADDVSDVWEDGVEVRFNENLQPGDLIWWRPGKFTHFARPQLAVFLGTLGYQRQYMLGDGRWIVEQACSQASPSFKQFASQKEVDQIRKHLPVKPLETRSPDFDLIMGYSFAGDIPSADAEPLMSRFAQFIEDMSTWRRENLALLDSLYDRIADEDRYITLQFEQVVTKFLGVDYSEVPPAALLTIYRTLQRKLTSVVVLRRRNYYPSATVSIIPKSLAKRFEQVCTWAREYQESAADAAMGKNVTTALEVNPLSAFVAKARRLILKSRALRSPTTIGSLGPSSIQGGIQDGEIPRKDNEETFTESDRMFIEFLWDCYVRYPVPDNNRNMAIASLILRAIGAYPKLRLDSNMGRLLLQELGTLPPWFLRADHNVALDLPHGRTSPELKRILDEADLFCQRSELSKTLNPHILGDSMASLRQDFGELPVYCVDTGETVIREDGFSIEPNPEIPGTYWVHGHTAHPTAFIDPEHIMAKRARRLTQTIFHHDHVARMLPKDFCASLSLRRDCPAMTISTLLTEAGEVLDIRIRPTTLRNVIFLSNAAVEQVLDRPEYEAATLSLGRAGPVKFEALQRAAPADMDLVQKHLPDIQLLEKLILAREERRKGDVAVVPDWEVQGSLSSMSYSYVFGSKYDEDGLFRSQQYQGDPAMRIKVTRYMRTNRVSDMAKYVTLTALLADLMSESAAKWFQDRKLPAVFFGSSYAPNFPPTKLNSLKRGEHAEYPPGKLSSSPIPHVHKSHQAHLWVSNPLRRYTELIAHWNADAYMQAEANGLVEPGEPGDKLELPITKEQIDKFIVEDAPKMYEWALMLQRSERKHWIIQALFRAFHFKEIELPEVWDLHVTLLDPTKTRPDDSGLRGMLLPFHIYAIILSSKEGWEKGTKQQSFLPVKLELVDLVHEKVVVRAVGPPSDTYTQTGPIHLGPKASPESAEDGASSNETWSPTREKRSKLHQG